MSFGPLRKKPKARRFHVYDLEWYPADAMLAKKHRVEPLGLRLVGHFDGERYQAYRGIQEFLRAVCTRKNSGCWFFAHAGGLADLVFVLEYLVENPRDGLTIKCAFSGSAAIIVKVSWGGYHWYFCDSYWLIRQPLREVAKWLGMQKGGEDDSLEHFYRPWNELRDYNENDNRILYTAISTFQKSILRLGGEMQKTIASTALDLFRRRFMTESISTDDTVNEWARDAYYASRVEVFEHECHDADYYDVNSSFPFAMTFEAPGNVLSIKRKLRDGELGLARAKIRVPECDIPPAPFRGKKDRRVYFPTGIWESWFNNVDLEFLEERGAEILEVKQAVSFEPFADLKRYAETIYEWRRTSKDEALRVVLKFLLNSLYGKFGEGSQKQSVFINPPPEFFDHPERVPGGLGREMLMPGVHALVEDRSIPHAHVPIAAHITAKARAVLGAYLVQSPRVYYCDTDGFGVPSSVAYETSDKLGGLKKEKHIFHARFAAPKLYAYQEEEGGDWTIRSKGFSRVKLSSEEAEKLGRSTRKITYEDFQQLLEHKDIPLEQFQRLRMLWRRGETRPSERIVPKTWVGSVRPKRAPGPGGTTRPWRVGELA